MLMKVICPNSKLFIYMEDIFPHALWTNLFVHIKHYNGAEHQVCLKEYMHVTIRCMHEVLAEISHEFKEWAWLVDIFLVVEQEADDNLPN